MTANKPIREALGLQRASENSIIPVILCGGSGSRLWPVSRKDMAKQHVPLFGATSPFQRTLARLDGTQFGTPIVISAAASRFMIAEQAAASGTEVEIALEPQGRDTLAAVTLAACLAARRDPSATVLVLPSDHLIGDVDAFQAAVAEAARLAEDGRIVMLGVTPTQASPGFGYIARGEQVAANAHAVARFVEKPDAASAAALVREGWLWNAGMFCFRAATGLREIEQHAPEALAAVRRAIEEASIDLGALVLGASFAAAPKISFDHAVMEHTSRAAVVSADFDWSDIGDWKSVWQRSPRDDHGVAREGRVHARDVSNCYLRSDGRLLCALGVDGLAVIDTADAVLIAPIERSHEIKALVNELEAEGIAEACTSARVHRPWGWYQTTDLGDRFRVKRILVKPGKKLSLQRHHHRAEHWVVVRGTAEVTRDDEVLILRENESVYLPLGCTHRLANPGKIPVEIIEVQTGAYLEEDDIVRIADDFGRI
ncbi:MAG TPA: mannose-1-phosphate guanylyltransferase/mannose-6-phosphate isomerase [Amaricoccus sp.]|uniref:mannose-1-phosphate guanylyltransferase/mannose-6-phosphate isomerase n=1 Tax=Amaricoccus sp. TaxID=1872485 RepID=UPI002C2101C1|nr:mannose-1-phosphate guanylyltransferase/mannose-6-phosphate isomerase [Amaricoccus sp.]HMQ92235.1 mannose-1-phosphate guanylyltransferase/mannose-6-phosphate isomerase [Amaricoccus sp.]HMR51640.1 mannose-1-phosphate guanylyltransferase/mannose-6-phosphate isomerase [Amaricoccus sp.]HMR59080.1 mannose-1-phosphate guanylyltransferase/mannose-6-phosphate isomerase [Amaricoccus sp.]HMT98424.1 mannose-1-phosphate guanylyltransferase/mannose-6-phosphate isomerase [Amaricoccus sp.]